MEDFVYFAHSLMSYDGDYERFCLSLIESKFPDVDLFNPNGKVAQTTDEDAMKHCLAAIGDDACKALVFSTSSGMVGKGVMREIVVATARQIPIYAIIGNKIFLTTGVTFTPIDFSNRVYAVANISCACEL
jgi:hypothetical protein